MYDLVRDLISFTVTDPNESCTWSLENVVLELCIRAGMDPRQLDTSQLREWRVRGFAVIATYPASEALRALSQVYMFEPANYDGRIHFQPRGADAIATVTEDDMVDTEEEIEQQLRADPIAIPRVLHLSYFDIFGGLAPDKQSSERSGDRRATGESTIQTPVLMHSEEAAKMIAVHHKVMIEDAKGELRFMLPDSWLHLTTADNIFVSHDGRVDRVRIAKVDVQDGYQEYACVRDRQSAYRSHAQGIPAAPQVPPPSGLVGPTLIQPLDISILRDADDNTGLGLYIAVAGIFSAWQGATIELSYDGGQNYVESGEARLSAIMGETMTALGDHPAEYPDYHNTVTVRVDTADAELFSTNLQGMQNRANRAIIGDEIICFETANEVSTGLWELSGFLRGRLGTLSTSHGIGERFVLLERGFISLEPASVTDIGRSITLRATSFGTSVDTGTVVTFTYVGRTQIERRVGYLMARREGSNMIVSWQGVGRLGGGGSVAHGARFAGYKVTFSDDVNPNIVVETDAQGLTQNVSALSSSPITVSVVQQNDLTGDGPSVEVIVA
jgi:hypothetical protein